MPRAKLIVILCRRLCGNRFFRFSALVAVPLLLASTGFTAPQPPGNRAKTYVGFDRNVYPGDELLDSLRATFAYTGYWLNTPPGETSNTWAGKRTLLKSRGFGFLVTFNGRLDKEIKGATKTPVELGAADAELAVAAAKREGFPRRAIIFLDQEEGGRLLPEQSAYLFSWIDGVRKADYRAGVYCSGIRVPDGGSSISTADDILSKDAGRNISLWIANDQCPPAPGCSVPSPAAEPALSGTPAALVWQYAQSPKRNAFAAACPGYSAADNLCYAPSVPHTNRSHVDLNTSTSADPSAGR
jgi:hypothetical protein